MFGSVVAQGQRGMKETVASREQGARGREQGARSKEQGAKSKETQKWETPNVERPTLKSVRRCG